MQGALVAILQLLLEAMESIPYVGPKEPLNNYIADEDALQALLEALPESDPDPTVDSREARIRNYLDIVQDRYHMAESAGLVTMLLRVRSAVAGTIKHVEGLPRGVRYREERLLLDIQGGLWQTMDGMDLVKGFQQPSAFTASALSAITAIMSLRNVDDVLIRVLGAKDAADALHRPLADVMALYRVEGDMAAPVSKKSIDDKIPPARKEAETSLNPRPSVGNLVMMYREGADTNHPYGGYWRTHMLVCWMVQIGGLDVYGKRPSTDEFAALSSDIRRELGAPNDSVSEARARWNDALFNMEEWAVTLPTERTRIGVPKDPVALVSFVLQEAVLYHEHLKSFGSFTLSAELAYLRYNVEKTFEGYLVRAATVAARGKIGAQYAALKSEIAGDSAFADAMKALDRQVDPMRDKAKAITILNDEWPTVLAWLQQPPVSAGNDRFELLAAFLQNATAREWKSYLGPRGNHSLYRRLRDYYSRVFF